MIPCGKLGQGVQIFGTERAVRIDSDQSPDDGIPDFLVNELVDTLRLPESVHSSSNGDIFDISVALDDCLAADSPELCTDAIVSPATSNGMSSFINVSLCLAWGEKRRRAYRCI